MDRRGGGGRKTLLAPIHFIFKLLQQRETVSIWLYEQLLVRIEGKIRVSASAANGKSNSADKYSVGFRRIHEPGH